MQTSLFSCISNCLQLGELNGGERERKENIMRNDNIDFCFKYSEYIHYQEEKLSSEVTGTTQKLDG